MFNEDYSHEDNESVIEVDDIFADSNKTFDDFDDYADGEFMTREDHIRHDSYRDEETDELGSDFFDNETI